MNGSPGKNGAHMVMKQVGGNVREGWGEKKRREERNSAFLFLFQFYLVRDLRGCMHIWPSVRFSSLTHPR